MCHYFFLNYWHLPLISPRQKYADVIYGRPLFGNSHLPCNKTISVTKSVCDCHQSQLWVIFTIWPVALYSSNLNLNRSPFWQFQYNIQFRNDISKLSRFLTNSIKFYQSCLFACKKHNQIGYTIRKNSGIIVLELAIESAEYAVNLFKDILCYP